MKSSIVWVVTIQVKFQFQFQVISSHSQHSTPELDWSYRKMLVSPTHSNFKQIFKIDSIWDCDNIESNSSCYLLWDEAGGGDNVLPIV